MTNMLRCVMYPVIGWAYYNTKATLVLNTNAFQPPTLCGTGNGTSQSAVMHCSWEAKAGWLIPLWISMWVAGKTV